MIDTINLEVTTKCPLRCPQCYVCFENGKDMAVQIAKYWLDEAKRNNCKVVALSGGETLCYPYLYDVIRYAKNNGLSCSASFSGVGFSDDVYQRLVDAGLDEIHISLNGSTREINDLTRDGYDKAIDALGVIRKNKKVAVAVNWVMHCNNCEDFPNLLRIADKNNVDYIQVLGFKPDRNNAIPSLPSARQMIRIRDYINNYHGNTKIVIESCYSQLRALVLDRGIWGNYNRGEAKGCIAGTRAISVSVDGFLSPCRHLKIYEKYETINSYLNDSPTVQAIKKAGEEYIRPCSVCKYRNNCKHCIAINYCLNGKLFFGDCTCPLANIMKD